MLDAVSLRVLGCLMEKEMTTPDAYPLSLNALLAACNQRSSREPVMELEEDAVRQGLHVLEARGLVAAARDGGRVARWEHRIRTVLQLRRDETALLCTLLLRGAQTPGELRSRSERMFAFDDLPAVQGALERMAVAAEGSGREEAIAKPLARAAGSREIRWVHLLGEGAEPAAAGDRSRSFGDGGAATGGGDLEPRVAALEALVAALAQRIGELERSDA